MEHAATKLATTTFTILAAVLGAEARGARLESAPNQAVSEDESARIVAELRSRHAPFFAQYAGVRSIRQIEAAITRDGQTEHRRLRVEHTTYFYRPPQQRILAAWQNGAAVAPEQVRQERAPGPPPFPVFDGSSAENYRLLVESIASCSGKPCYLIRVRPNRQTERHLNGTLYVDQASLHPLRFVGGLARFPTGVKSMHLDIHYGQHSGRSVVVRGTTRVRAYIPMLVPETTLVTSFSDEAHVFLR